MSKHRSKTISHYEVGALNFQFHQVSKPFTVKVTLLSVSIMSRKALMLSSVVAVESSLVQIVSQISVTTFKLVTPAINRSKGLIFIMKNLPKSPSHDRARLSTRTQPVLHVQNRGGSLVFL
ncbi:hypothetical protein EVAR_5134_1 [Eumeta japonica]|uniref:Uncharacterized protein n=1 Tax=Eumeta variegata TaxID=151549 RepID=A0A4C1SUD1_EUMVA|nr:hypothetical protein EVAR_5134_1 [Eumeta japonica]